MSTEKNSINTKPDIDYQIEISTQTLERNLGFISNCDNKASIILTAVGVLLTIILTNDGISNIFNLIKSCISTKTFCDIIFLIVFVASLITLLIGMLLLICVLIAKLDLNRIKGIQKNKSRIYFGDIYSHYTYIEYKKAFLKMKKNDLLDDLISQIFINSTIATKKYKRYNLGFKLTMIGFFVFIVVLLIGNYIY